MGKQKEGYCRIEKKIVLFTETQNPGGYWVCTKCGYRTKELLKPPKIESPYEDYLAQVKKINGWGAEEK
jgi:hypothetical protein